LLSPADVKIMTAAALTQDMEDFVATVPRSWYEILKHYHDHFILCFIGPSVTPGTSSGRQTIHHGVGARLQPVPFAYEAKPQMPNHSDPRHIKTTVP
jgi:hypothetical protein